MCATSHRQACEVAPPIALLYASARTSMLPRAKPTAPPAMAPRPTNCTVCAFVGSTISEMMAKGTYASLVLGSKDLDALFERLQATDTEIVQEPTDQPYGVRDCAVRDPAGHLLRIQQLA